jgi:pyruvate/2-oxoglutarate dehydrogenase complex dihydrolipoamide dehydrogenase (E3) component
VRLNTYAELADVLADQPSAVIIATGGLPNTDWLDGAEHCTTVWDMLVDATQAKDDVLVFDGTGRHQAVSCALHLAELGRDVQFVTTDEYVAMEMEYPSRTVYRKRFAENGVKVTTDNTLVRVRQSGNRLVATFKHELTDAVTELTASQVVIEHGTIPMTELFDSLRAKSANDGVTEIDALLARQPQLPALPQAGAFELHRIGDAVTSRNVHGAIYDALRLCSAL